MLPANGRNNSQHCWANNAGSCCVRVGSGVQTDATTSNIVGTSYSASSEGYNPWDFVNFNSAAILACTWPQQWIQHFCTTFRRSRNKRNVGSWRLRRLTGFKLCATTSNKQQPATVQTDATRNIQQCWELLANNVASVCKGVKAPFLCLATWYYDCVYYQVSLKFIWKNSTYLTP